MSRTPDQQAMEIFEGRLAAPHEWGRNDCCLALADVLAPVWGVDVAASYRGRYQSVTSFLKLLAEEECDSLQELVERIALAAGAKPFDSETPQDFDAGFILASYRPEVTHRMRPRLAGLPAFFRAGMWVGMTKTGMVAVPEALKMWRKPLKAGG